MNELRKPLRALAAALLLATSFAAARRLPAQTPSAPQHPVSTPYAGDLGIFEEKGREDRLHIDRVMDLLHIRPEKLSPTSAREAAGFPCERRGAWRVRRLVRPPTRPVAS